MMPADASESGSHERSASESGRKPPNPSSKTSTAPGLPPRRRHPSPRSGGAGCRSGRARPGRAASCRAAASAATRRGPPRRRTGGRSGTRSLACGSAVCRRWPVPPPSSSAGCRARPPPAGRGRRSARANGWRRPRSGRPLRGRSARPAGAARPSGCRAGRAAISTPSASSQGALSSTAAVPRARRVEAGGVDHQHRRPVAAQELAPGEIDRFAGAAAFGQTRLPARAAAAAWASGTGPAC